MGKKKKGSGKRKAKVIPPLAEEVARGGGSGEEKTEEKPIEIEAVKAKPKAKLKAAAVAATAAASPKKKTRLKKGTYEYEFRKRVTEAVQELMGKKVKVTFDSLKRYITGAGRGCFLASTITENEEVRYQHHSLLCTG